MEHLHHSYQMSSVEHNDQLEMTGRSTRGASKYRRDQINLEIQRLRDLLPLNSCVKDRLFQLQVMSLACIYIRKQRYLSHIIQTCEKPIYPLTYSMVTPNDLDIYKALRGFLIMLTNEGKILHISENASEFLGYSVEEIMCQGDVIYDLVDTRDHSLFQQQLAMGPISVFESTFPLDSSFVCRMNLSKTVKRQLNCYKYIMLEGRYIHPTEYYKTINMMADGQPISPIFAAFCTPLLCPKNVDSLCRGSVQVFQNRNEMDLKVIDMDAIALDHLGYFKCDISFLSLYDLIHPDRLETLAEMHQTLCREKDGSVMGLLRLKNKNNKWTWLHSVLTIKSDQILGTFQIFNDEQANSLLNSPWIYSTKHYSNYRGDIQKDADFLSSSPESNHRKQLEPNIDQSSIFVNPHFNSSDANNNYEEKPALLSNQLSPDSNSVLSAAAKSICLEQLQQLCKSEYFGTTLPDLDRQDLEDFFRQVEQSSNSTVIKNEPEFVQAKGIKREYHESEWTPSSSWNQIQFGPTQLPPVSSLASFEDAFGDQMQQKRHRFSLQLDQKQSDPFSGPTHNNNNAWPEQYGNWTGIQTG